MPTTIKAADWLRVATEKKRAMKADGELPSAMKTATKRAMKTAMKPKPIKRAMKRAMKPKPMKRAMKPKPMKSAWKMLKTGGGLEVVMIPSNTDCWAYFSSKWWRWDDKKANWQEKQANWQVALLEEFNQRVNDEALAHSIQRRSLPMKVC